MKILHSLLLSLSIITISNVNAQCLTHDAKLNLSGKWIANCATEFKDKATIEHCQICQFVVDKDDHSKATIGDIKMNFSKDSVSISTNGSSETVKYYFDEKSNTINFSYKNNDHSFRILYSRKQVILEDKERSALLLTKDDQ